MEWVTIAVMILQVVLVLFILYGKNYIKKKAENLATQEDIGKITKEIEEVKNKYILITHKQQALFEEKRNILFSYFDSYFVWYKKLRYVIGLIALHHDEELNLSTLGEELTSYCNSAMIYYNRILLHEKNDEVFIKELKRHYVKTDKLHHKTFYILLRLEEAIKRNNRLISRKAKQDEFHELWAKRNNEFKEYIDYSKKAKAEINKLNTIILDVFKAKLESYYK